MFLGDSGFNRRRADHRPGLAEATNAYTGLYAVDAFDVTDRLTVTAGGRFNVANIRLQDQLGDGARRRRRLFALQPDGRRHVTRSRRRCRPTPAIPKPTARRRRWSSAAPIPRTPASSPRFLVSDPALKQVVAHTGEMGLRGSHDLGGYGHLDWKLGVWRTDTSGRHPQRARSRSSRATAISRTSAARGARESRRMSTIATTS